MSKLELHSNKKKIITYLITVYIFLIIYSFLFPPVKATLGDDCIEAGYGYYPIWELNSNASKIELAKSADDSAPKITIQLNYLALIIQSIFITLVFLTLIIRALRRSSRKR